jgi:hypothetical protein
LLRLFYLRVMLASAMFNELVRLKALS